MEFLYLDNQIAVCIKPAGVLSTDEPGGLPELVREALNSPAIYTVHRLDRAVGGVMLLARTRHAASDLGRQIMAGGMEKQYLAVLRGVPDAPTGTLTDWLARDKAARKTLVVPAAYDGAQKAVLDYAVLAQADGMTLVRVTLHTGRTHQIRAQFASRGLPLAGDRKYGAPETEDCGVALWSNRIAFIHPKTGERIDVSALPPAVWPWTEFKIEE